MSKEAKEQRCKGSGALQRIEKAASGWGEVGFVAFHIRCCTSIVAQSAGRGEVSGGAEERKGRGAGEQTGRARRR